ncbi:MAG: TraR/DksA family transcriptional regulator [Opitutales bacterium]
MTLSQQEHFRPIIEARIAELEQALENSAEDARAVEPDKAIGRLSRLDAMQMQHMTLGAQNRHKQEIRQLRDALGLIDRGQFGTCALCGKDIAAERLEYQPNAAMCVACAR